MRLEETENLNFVSNTATSIVQSNTEVEIKLYPIFYIASLSPPPSPPKISV